MLCGALVLSSKLELVSWKPFLNLEQIIYLRKGIHYVLINNVTLKLCSHYPYNYNLMKYNLIMPQFNIAEILSEIEIRSRRILQIDQGIKFTHMKFIII